MAGQRQLGNQKKQLSPVAAVLLLACAAALVSPPGVAQPQMRLETLGPGGQLYTLSVPDGDLVVGGGAQKWTPKLGQCPK